jgi:NADH:ubiquinone oxidoreductase subunit 2 (subunit N)
VLAVLTSIVGVYYYFKVILAMYVKPGDEQSAVKFPMMYMIVAFICMGLSLLLGVWPNILNARMKKPCCPDYRSSHPAMMIFSRFMYRV